MVCPRCIMAVENIFKEMKIQPLEVRLGEALLEKELSDQQKEVLKEKLEKLGFEILDDKNAKIIHQIKTILIKSLQNSPEENLNLAEFISANLGREYSQLSKIFSSTTGITIEQFYILQKIEKVKEYLIYDELSLKEIAYQLGYSSPAHLSSQFKKFTGMTPTKFKSLSEKERKAIDGI